MSRFSCYGVVDPNDSEAAGVCDRGGEVRKRRELRPELAYRGDRLVETGFLVCDHHRDVPQPQDRARHLPADPVPVRQPRPDYDFQQPLALAAGVLVDIGIADGGTTPEGAAFPGLGIIDPAALDEVWYTPRGGPSIVPAAPPDSEPTT